MRIVHLMLSCFYIDNANYQENALPRQNKEDGHEVFIIASTEIFVENNILGYTMPRSYISEDGISVTRLPYCKIINRFFSAKIRKYLGLSKVLEDLYPDVIYFHGMASYDMVTVANYKKTHSSVSIFVDSHEDYNNSGRNFLSKYILHRIVYRKFIKKALPYIKKILYITAETKSYIEKEYGVYGNILSYYPLGGYVFSNEEYFQNRLVIRKQLNISDIDTVFMHSGKMDFGKKTLDVMSAFTANKEKNYKLVIVGSFSDDIINEAHQYINKDNRILFVGWKSGSELITYLCGADLYIQPGGQSATMQNALCSRCAVALYPHLSHKALLGDAAFYIESVDDIAMLLDEVAITPALLEQRKNQCFEIAKNKLDYKSLTRIIYE